VRETRETREAMKPIPYTVTDKGREIAAAYKKRQEGK